MSQPSTRGVLIIVAAVIVVIVVLAVVALAIITQNDDRAAATSTAVAQAATDGAMINMTATAASDVDLDGLTCARELENGTLCDNADTDSDGLSDGDEVLKYHTTPVAQIDSDGDGLMDGAEVLIDCGNGNTLDPSNPDTDGDGINDGNDLDPCDKSTAMPTIEATIAGASNDTCSGSPADRLTGQTGGIVISTIPLRVHASPGNSPSAPPLEKPGTKFSILDPAPVCDLTARLRWWHVHFEDGIEGWVAEGDKSDTETPYYLAPLVSIGTATPVPGS